MKKIYIFKTKVMNGTVTVNSEVAAFTDRELAEQTRLDIINANQARESELEPLMAYCTGIEECVVYETKAEIPFYQKQ